MTTDAAPLGRPVPVPEEWSEAYWAGARAGQLLITLCGRGRVYGFSIMRLPGVPGFQPPYAVAVVELDEQAGLLTVGNVLHCALEDIAVGMPVEVTFRAVTDTVTLPQWQPIRDR
jgi:uncharacterized OB-fold protein